MDLKRVFVALDRRTRFLDAAGLGVVRSAGRRLLGAALAKELTAEVDGLVFAGTIQHRSYLLRLESGSAEPFTSRLLAEATMPGGSFVDAGAFLGFYTLAAAAAGARVTSIEPNPATRALLERNLHRNGLEHRVAVHSCALSERSMRVDYFVGEGDQSSSGLAPNRSNRRPLTVEARPLDDLVEAADVVKMDLEGAEIQALRGMSRLLARRRPMVIVAECNPPALERLGGTDEMLVAELEGHGFEVRVIDEERRLLVPWRTWPRTRRHVNLHAVR